jgi:hypothetical protein
MLRLSLMTNANCPCVFPSPTEEEWITLPSTDGQTALRVYVQAGTEGYVRLQQVAYDEGAGWYVQKTFVVPGEMLSTLATQFRRADCLIPKGTGGAMSIPAMRLVGDEGGDAEPQRRRA